MGACGCDNDGILQLTLPYLSPLFTWLCLRPINRTWKAFAERDIEQWLQLLDNRDGPFSSRLYFAVFLSTSWNKRLHQHFVHSHLANGDFMAWMRFKRYNSGTGCFEFEPNHQTTDGVSSAALHLTRRQLQEWSGGKHAQLLITSPLWLPDYRPAVHTPLDHTCIFCCQSAGELKRVIPGMPKPTNDGDGIFEDDSAAAADLDEHAVQLPDDFLHTPPPSNLFNYHNHEYWQEETPQLEVLADGTVVRNCYDSVLHTPRKRHLPSCRCRRHFHCDTEERLNREFGPHWPPLQSMSFSFKSPQSVQEEFAIRYHSTPDLNGGFISTQSSPPIASVQIQSMASDCSSPLVTQKRQRQSNNTLPSPPPTQLRRRSKRLAAAKQQDPSDTAAQYSSDGVISGDQHSPTLMAARPRKRQRPDSPFIPVEAERQECLLVDEMSDYLLDSMQLQDITGLAEIVRPIKSSLPSTPEKKQPYGSFDGNISKQSTEVCRWNLDALICTPSFLFGPMLAHACRSTLDPPSAVNLFGSSSSLSAPLSSLDNNSLTQHQQQLWPVRKRWNQMFQLSDIEESDGNDSDKDFWQSSQPLNAKQSTIQYPSAGNCRRKPSSLFSNGRLTRRQFDEYLAQQGLSPIRQRPPTPAQLMIPAPPRPHSPPPSPSHSPQSPSPFRPKQPPIR